MSDQELTYLASPYSHPYPMVREHRFEAVCKKAAELMSQGLFVFSPIAHGHPLTKHGALGDWAYWEKYCIKMIQLCDTLTIFQLEGWRESKGVTAEIKIAKEFGKPVCTLSPYE